MNKYEFPTAGSCNIPVWASLCGVKVSTMEGYCGALNHGDKLPRGMESKIERMRPRILAARLGGGEG